MHIRAVLRIVFILLAIIALFMLLPLIVAWADAEMHLANSFLIPAGIILCIALVFLLTSGRKPNPPLSTRDGFLLVTLSWVLASFFGSLPFVLSGAIPHIADAYFETMSGFTTTGASILTQIEAMPRCLLFWRSLTHWLGGMGIVVLTVALFPLLGIGGQFLLQAEAPGPILEKPTARITQAAKVLWLTYLFLTILETVLLMAGGMDLFDSLTHTFGTLATGGFSPKNASVGHYTSGYLHIVITIFMLMAGVNFNLYYRIITGKAGFFFKNTELRTYLLIFGTVSLVIAWDLLRNNVFGSWATSLRFASFQSASIITTTGYATADFTLWPVLSRVLLFFLMFIGGCSGSTGGGIKVIRIMTMFKLAIHEMKHLLHPRGVFSIRMNGSPVKKDGIYPVAGFFFLYLLLLMFFMLCTALAGNNILTSISTSLVTLGNIGPGFGKIGPSCNYAFYPAWLKWVLSFAMLAGRLELFTVLVILTPQFWKH